jgi:hypothetical protein
VYSGPVRACFLLTLILPLGAAGHDSVIPSLDYGPACTSTIEAVNPSDAPVTAQVQAHKGGGALVMLVGQAEAAVRIPAKGRVTLKLQVENEAGTGWVRIREPGDPQLVLAGAVECVDGDRLVSAPREVVYPMRNPWFAGDTAGLPGGMVTAINTSSRPVRASACFSSGNLVSNGQPQLVPLCSATFDFEIPPFGTRQVSVEKADSSWFSLRTTGEAVVLEMLRPLAPRVKLYRVDSTIQFGQEVTPVK